MPRIRTIKPDFFRSEELYQTERIVNMNRDGAYLNIRTAFAGMFTVADREGRFKWKPNQLKLDCLPFDPIDFNEVLAVLQSNGNPPFLIKYKSGDHEFGWITGFATHQRPHHTEPKSTIPEPPPLSHRDLTVTSPLSHGEHPEGREGKGREGKRKGKEGTSQIPAAPRPPRPASRPAGAQGKTPPGPQKAPEVAPGAPKDPPKVSQDPPTAKRPQSKPSLPSRPKAGAVPEGSAHRLAAFLRNLILANDPKARVPKLISKAFQTWTREASLLFRDRSVQESVALLRWALDNEFWRANILSIPKFRKRYTQLLLNRRSDKAAEERKHPACPICQVMKPRPGHDLCTNCARCGRCGRAPEGDNLMRFTIEIRRDKTKRAICRSCSGKKSKESGHPGLTAVKNAMKEAIS